MKRNGCRICGVVMVGFLVSSALAAHAQRVAVDAPRNMSSVLTRPVSIVMKNVVMRDAIDALAQRANVRISYQADVVDGVGGRVSLSAEQMPLGAALDKVLRGTTLYVVPVSDGLIVLKSSAAAPASVAQGGISGKVVDVKTKEGLRGVTVTLDDGTKGTTSGDGGEFRFANVAPGQHTLHIRLLGYVKTTKAVTVAEAQVVSVDVTLERSVNALDQVVVTGMVVATVQKAVPNAMTVITAKDIERNGIADIAQLFRGDVPGLFAANVGSGNPTGQVIMFSRGATSFEKLRLLTYGTTDVSGMVTSTNAMKTYVDGVELTDPRYLSQIDTRTIERIEIVAGPQASTIYGSNALNGVMQIFTKRGTTQRPQLTASLMSGLIQNNFRPALAPQHDYSAQVTGIEGHWSYRVNGSWSHMGRWSPASQNSSTGGSAGMRTQFGALTADASLRLSASQSSVLGQATQEYTAAIEQGTYATRPALGLTAPRNYNVNGQTMGLTLGYTLFGQWSHELVLGTDVLDNNQLTTGSAYTTPTDTFLNISQSHSTRTSLRYSTTARVPVTSMAQAVITLGADSWEALATSMSTSPPLSLTGTLGGTPTVSRVPGHNAGGFIQAQLGIWDALFLTYGLRAEWNPNFGDSVTPNLAPRYGIAYSRDFGIVTAKVRASYARSTRPPTSGEFLSTIDNTPNTVSIYGQPLMTQLASPDLGPEFQQGGEGGLELYFGNYGGIVITRYNQTVDGLIDRPKVDSVPSVPYPYGTGYNEFYYGLQYQYLNIGSIRNQGWEWQSTVNTGPLTTKATYSWTQSRVLGITPRYRTALLGTQYTPGSSFKFLPEHTWALDVSYARGGSTLSVGVNGTGRRFLDGDQFNDDITYVRLPNDKARMSTPTGYKFAGTSYAIANLNASHRFSTELEGVLQVQNLANTYQNDYSAAYVAMGRLTKAGLRLRW